MVQPSRTGHGSASSPGWARRASRRSRQLAGAAVDDTAAASSARASAYASVTAALEAASAERAYVVVLDDLHWADEGTVGLLAAVAGQLPALPVLVVATYRDTEVLPGSPLTRLSASADRVALHGLDRGGVAALLSGPLGRERAEGAAEEVQRRTGGNPFLVVQLGRLLASDPAALGERRAPGRCARPARRPPRDARAR